MEFRVQQSKGEACQASGIKGHNTKKDCKRPLGHWLPCRWIIKLSKANHCLGAKASEHLHPPPMLHTQLSMAGYSGYPPGQGLAGTGSLVGDPVFVLSNRQLLRQPERPVRLGSVVLQQAEQTLLYVDSFMLSLNARQVCFLDPPSLRAIFSRDAKAERGVRQ